MENRKKLKIPTSRLAFLGVTWRTGNAFLLKDGLMYLVRLEKKGERFYYGFSGTHFYLFSYSQCFPYRISNCIFSCDNLTDL